MMKLNVARLQEFFFEGSLWGYAGGGEKIIIPDVKKTRRFVYYRGELLYRDEYVVNGEYSGGSTVIYMDGLPVWLMQYHGWCQNDNSDVLAFLKKVLTKTYQDSEFCGGRGKFGSWTSDDGSLVYENHPTLPPSMEEFVYFMRYERIKTRVWKSDQSHEVFWHRYQGLLLGEAE